MRIVVSGGGTGGHIMPALATLESLMRLCPDSESLYIGAKTGMESELVPHLGVPYQGIATDKLRKTLSLSTPKVLFSVWQGYREAITYLRAFNADIVIGTGGYVAAAAVMAGVKLGLPTLIHEGNAVAGRTNLWLSKRATRIATTFEEVVHEFPREKTVVTGLPLRKEIVAPNSITPAQARLAFNGLFPERFTLLVTGGSQGAQRLNSVVLEAVPALLSAGIQVLHLTGRKNYEQVSVVAKANGLLERGGYALLPFCDEKTMPLAWRAASAVLCRGGVSTSAEAWANGVPSILVPLPTAYADHQTANARIVERHGAGLLRPELGLTAEQLAQDVLRFQTDTAYYARLQQGVRALSSPDAADRVALEALRLTRR